jgi:hypothetical protein
VVPGLRVEAVELGGFNDGVENGGAPESWNGGDSHLDQFGTIGVPPGPAGAVLHGGGGAGWPSWRRRRRGTCSIASRSNSSGSRS